jgi:hypothetical protein
MATDVVRSLTKQQKQEFGELAASEGIKEVAEATGIPKSSLVRWSQPYRTPATRKSAASRKMARPQPVGTPEVIEFFNHATGGHKTPAICNAMGCTPNRLVVLKKHCRDVMTPEEWQIFKSYRISVERSSDEVPLPHVISRAAGNIRSRIRSVKRNETVRTSRSATPHAKGVSDVANALDQAAALIRQQAQEIETLKSTIESIRNTVK